MVNLAGIYKGQGVDRFEEAVSMFVRAIEIMKVALPKNHASVAQSLCSLAALYKRMKRFTEAKWAFAEALKIQRKAFPKYHVVIAKTLSHLALM